MADRVARADVALLIRLEGMAGKVSWFAGALYPSGQGTSYANVYNCDSIVDAAIS